MWEFLDHEHAYGDAQVVTIGLLLPPEQQAAAIRFSTHVCRDISCGFQLDAAHNPPIVRLYETVIPSEDLEQARALTEQLAQDMIPFEMRWGEMERTLHFAAIWGEINEPLALFHRALLEQINPLRKGYFKLKYTDERRELSREEHASLDRWGSPWAEPYIPHMVLAKYAIDSYIPDEQETWDYSKANFSGLFFGIKKAKKFELVAQFPFHGRQSR